MVLELIGKKSTNFTPAHLKIFAGFSLFYALWTSFVIEARIDHLFFYLLLFFCFFFSQLTRSFALGFSFFTIFWILYDGLRCFPNFKYSPVHIIEPYNLEKSLFGIFESGKLITLNEYFSINSHKFLDIITGIFYLTWVPIPFALALYFFQNDKKRLLQFSAAYLFTNLIGFIGYYTYPAAPPWYFFKYGNVLRFDVPSNAAGLLNFDKLINYPLFENIYTKNSNVFAAIPSLHSAYPMVALYYAKGKVPKWFVWVIFIDVIGIWFSAVYLSHHYIIDVLAGMLVAIISIVLFEKFIFKSIFSNFISNFAQFIHIK